MNTSKWFVSATIVLVLISHGFGPVSAHADGNGPKVKKSNARTCYEKGSSSYNGIKTFTPYDSMEACLKSGGRSSAGSSKPAETPSAPADTTQETDRPEPTH